MLGFGFAWLFDLVMFSLIIVFKIGVWVGGLCFCNSVSTFIMYVTRIGFWLFIWLVVVLV